MQDTSNTRHSKIMLMLLSAANVGLNLVLQFACVLVLGAGPVTDAYFSAQTVPLLASAILAAALTNNLTPMAARLDDTRRSALVKESMRGTTLLALVLFGVLAATCQWWVPTLFSGLALDVSQLASSLAQVFCMIAAAQVISAIGIAGHYARGRFAFVESLQVLATLVTLLVANYVINVSGIIGFAYLLAARALAVCVVVNYGFANASRLARNELTAAFWMRTRQLMSASIVFKTGPIIDRVMASFSASGVMTSLGIGQQVIGSSLAISERVFARPLMVAAGAHAVASAESAAVLLIYYRQLRILLIFTAAAILIAVPIGLVALQQEKLLGSLAQHAFGHVDLVCLMLLAIVPAAAGQMSAALMYAIGDIKTINRLAMLSFILSTCLKVFGFLFFGAYAIVAGIFIYQALNWLLLHIAAVRSLSRSNT